MKKEKQEGLVFTNEKCIGCNKCISVCPVITANKAVDEDGKQIIQVDGDKCISCGACFDEIGRASCRERVFTGV